MVDEDSFLLTGVNIEGANWNIDTKMLELNDEISTPLTSLLFKWIPVEKKNQMNLSFNFCLLFSIFF